MAVLHPILDGLTIMALAAVMASHLRADLRRFRNFFHVISVAVALLYCSIALSGGWQSDLAHALRTSTLAAIVIHGTVSIAVWRSISPLVLLLAPYAMIVLLLARLLSLGDQAALAAVGGEAGLWLIVHIAVALGAYATIILAAIAALSVFWVERSLKDRQGRSRIAATLPSVWDAERAQNLFLIWGEVILGTGLLSGMALNALNQQPLIVLDHKTLLLFGAFSVIAILLIGQKLLSVRGRPAARFVLVAYLLLTLGYPGVKFVGEVLLT